MHGIIPSIASFKTMNYLLVYIVMDRG